MAAAWYNCRAMADPNLQSVAEGVVRRARQQGSVTTGDIRSELKLAGLPEGQWKDVAALVKGELRFRQGRYYPAEAVSSRRAEAEAQQDRIAKAIRGLIRHASLSRKSVNGSRSATARHRSLPTTKLSEASSPSRPPTDVSHPCRP